MLHIIPLRQPSCLEIGPDTSGQKFSPDPPLAPPRPTPRVRPPPRDPLLHSCRHGYPAEHVLMELGEAFHEPILVDGIKVRLSFSAGLALCPEDGSEAAQLWRSAETALSKARAAPPPS
jgi:hypothetical protein